MFIQLPDRVMTKIEYEKDAKIIYEQSFSIARQEADLKGFNEKEAKVAIRIAHASGMPHVTSHLRFTSGAISAGISAILKGAPIICDCNMVKVGISMTDKLPGNELLCFLNHPEVANIAKHQKTTRSAAQIELWKEHINGAIVVIGNAPTALFRLIEKIYEKDFNPALVIGFPVGFVGASESKSLLNNFNPRIQHLTLLGRLGGSAMAAAACNALLKIAAKSNDYE